MTPKFIPSLSCVIIFLYLYWIILTSTQTYVTIIPLKKKKRSPLTAHLCLYPLCCFSGSCKNISSVFKLVPLLFLPMLITLFPHHFTKTFIQVVIILPKVMFNCLSSYLTFEYHLRWLIILFSKYVLPLPSKWCFFIILMEKHMT